MRGNSPMSQVTEAIPADHVPHAGRQPSALAILAATALGGVIGSRLGKTPLVLAAGAATLALLNSKKASSGPKDAPVPSEYVPEPEPELKTASALTQIDQWLARQMDREAQNPAVPLPTTPEIAEAKDDYVPQPLLIDDADEAAPAAAYETFAHLAKPPPPQPKPSLDALGTLHDLPMMQPLGAAETSPAVVRAAWLPGIEPLPSLGEMMTSPLWQSAPELPPMFTAPVFDGGAFPDEIEVQPPVEPLVHLMPVALTGAQSSVPEPVEEVVQEIAVSLASPGEASFDPPPVVVPDPWQTETLQSAAPETVVSPPNGPVIDAEIVLRPRAVTSNAVLPREAPISPRFTKTNASAGLPVQESNVSDGAAPRPAQPPPRKAWRSWWRGD